MNKIKTGVQKFGFIPSRTHPITYQIGEAQMSSLSPSSAADSAPETLTALSVGDYFVWPNGVDNLDPTICKELIKGSRLLPSLIEKQISILYGLCQFIAIGGNTIFQVKNLIGVSVYFILGCSRQADKRCVKIIENITVFVINGTMCFVTDYQIKVPT